MDKKEIRKIILEKRNKFDIEYIGEVSKKIVNYILNNEVYIKNKHIFIYNAFGSEINLNSLIDKAFQDNKKLYLPITRKNDIFFVNINRDTTYVRSSYGILEPIGNEEEFFEEGLVIVPMLAYNDKFYRVGYGKGYYDRFLSKNKNLYKMGVCYKEFNVEIDFQDEYDINLDEIVAF